MASESIQAGKSMFASSDNEAGVEEEGLLFYQNV